MKKHEARLFELHGFNGQRALNDLNDQELLDKWINGTTGDDFVDANMRELKYTGFMSNRGRQNVASYLIDQLKVDWRFGAAYFEEQLIDYDVSSNWGNWAYLAGVGNDPRGKRVFNTDKQATDYDPEGKYRELWI
jgi:deoxyribodipyrimidine photo-lyase